MMGTFAGRLVLINEWCACTVNIDDAM